MELIFISFLVHIRFPLFNSIWLINVVNITSCIFLKQHFKGTILIIVVCICEFINKSSTEINILRVICNRSNYFTKYRYIIAIKHINSIYVLFDSQGHIIQGLRILIDYHKTVTFGWVI